MKIFTYLLIDLGCIIIPLIASFYPKRAFYKYWKPFFLANVIVTIPFLVWDVIFTERGVWGFNEDYLTGYYFFNLPIEEVLFFICIPYACVFTFFAFKYLFPKNPLISIHKPITVMFVIISLLFIGLGWNQLYTLSTGIFTLVILIYSLWKQIDLGNFYLAYFAIIPFFIASNGLLTGSLLDNPIVWYNDYENFGLRVLTIPIEDFVYALLLLALNIILFDKFSEKQERINLVT